MKFSCSTCTYNGSLCPKHSKNYPNGNVINSCTGKICGHIDGCVHYKGRYHFMQSNLFEI